MLRSKSATWLFVDYELEKLQAFPSERPSSEFELPVRYHNFELSRLYSISTKEIHPTDSM